MMSEQLEQPVQPALLVKTRSTDDVDLDPFVGLADGLRWIPVAGELGRDGFECHI